MQTLEKRGSWVRSGLRSIAIALGAALLSSTLNACGDDERPRPHGESDCGACGEGGVELGRIDAGRTDAGHGIGVPADASTRACGEPPATITEGPLLGAVSDQSIKIWARGDRAGNVTVHYWPREQPEQRAQVTAELAVEHDHTAVAVLEGLLPMTSYAYRLQTDGCEPGPEHAFTTLPASGQPARIRFVAAGDILGGDVPGFDDIGAVAPDFVLMVGDNVYADGFGMTFDAYRERYLGVWRGTQFQALFESVPAFSTWDDHELVDNYWKGKNDVVYEFASRLYDDYQGSRNPDPLLEGERYYTFHAGDVGFFVLDTRTHRSPNTDSEGPAKSMLGGPQKDALLAWLKDDESRVHVLLSSVLMSPFSTTGMDSWAGFTTERDELLGAVATERPENLLVVSGDQHWSAILRLDHASPEPYTVYEFQATPLAFNERGAPDVTSDAVLALDNSHRVFGVFDVDTEVDPPALHYTLCVVGRACDPHQEPFPIASDGTTTLPYSVTFEGTGSGFHLVSQ